MSVVPQKLMNYGKQAMGVKSFDQCKVQRVTLLPNHSNSSQSYSASGVNKVHFRIPAYSHSFMDNARSFLSYKVQLTTPVNTNTTNKMKLSDTPGCWIKRLTLKTGTGLVLESIDNYNVLSKIHKGMSVEDWAGIDQGNYSSVIAGVNRLAIADTQSAGAAYIYKIPFGILSETLGSYLPLHLMSQQGFAFDLELELADSESCTEWVSTDDGASYDGTAPSCSYRLYDMAYNICLVTIDDSLCQKFNKIACSQDDKIVIPFHTYHNHQSAVSSQNQTVFISDNCNDIRKIYTAFLAADSQIPPIGNDSIPFYGSCKESGGDKLISYNYKINNDWIYSDPVQETISNHISLNHFINAHHLGAGPAMALAKLNRHEGTTLTTSYESRQEFVLCPDLTYSADLNVTQGISPGAHPISLNLKFDGTPVLTCQNFVQCGYDLVLENGSMSYVEKATASCGC